MNNSTRLQVPKEGIHNRISEAIKQIQQHLTRTRQSDQKYQSINPSIQCGQMGDFVQHIHHFQNPSQTHIIQCSHDANLSQVLNESLLAQKELAQDIRSLTNHLNCQLKKTSSVPYFMPVNHVPYNCFSHAKQKKSEMLNSTKSVSYIPGIQLKQEPNQDMYYSKMYTQQPTEYYQNKEDFQPYIRRPTTHKIIQEVNQNKEESKKHFYYNHAKKLTSQTRETIKIPNKGEKEVIYILPPRQKQKQTHSTGKITYNFHYDEGAVRINKSRQKLMKSKRVLSKQAEQKKKNSHYLNVSTHKEYMLPNARTGEVYNNALYTTIHHKKNHLISTFMLQQEGRKDLVKKILQYVEKVKY